MRAGLTYHRFLAEYARLVFAEEESRNKHGNKHGVRRASIQERASYWQLYKLVHRMEGRYMEYMRRARGMSTDR